MATAQDMTDQLRERAGEANEALRETAARAKSELESIVRRADVMTRQLVADYPLATLIGAVVAGYVVGRVIAGRS